MERLRRAVAGADWADLELSEAVTVSIGVASAPGLADGQESEGAVGWRSLFDTADLHLFSAKRSGRNRVRAPGAAASDETPEDSA
jgi:PleD family two-component response regulator